MKAEFIYGSSVVTLPADVKKFIKNASKTDLRVLIALAAGEGTSAEALARACDATESEIVESLAFWRGTGVVRTEDVARGQTAEPSRSPAAEPTVKASRMTSEEIARICGEHEDLKNTVDKCQRLFGKVFTYSESGVIVYLYDHLRLDCEYIVLLCSYCKNHGHDSVRYLEKTALSLFDRGIDNVEKLENHFISEAKKNDLEYKIRKLYGFGERALTAKESEYINTWANDWQLPFELIEAGYERMMSSISDPKLHYENKILKSWHDAGVKTVADIEKTDPPKSSAKSAQNKKAKPDPSFDIDEFFKLAVERGKTGSGREGGKQ